MIYFPLIVQNRHVLPVDVMKLLVGMGGYRCMSPLCVHLDVSGTHRGLSDRLR